MGRSGYDVTWISQSDDVVRSQPKSQPPNQTIPSQKSKDEPTITKVNNITMTKNASHPMDTDWSFKYEPKTKSGGPVERSPLFSRFASSTRVEIESGETLSNFGTWSFPRTSNALSQIHDNGASQYPAHRQEEKVNNDVPFWNFDPWPTSLDLGPQLSERPPSRASFSSIGSLGSVDSGISHPPSQGRKKRKSIKALYSSIARWQPSRGSRPP